MSLPFYTFRSEQWVPRPLEEVFAFFADAHNLEQITPPWLGFRIVSMDTDTTREGSNIRYRLKLHGIPIHWKTEIKRWRAPHCFVDIQRSGPYQLWHHTHRFEAHGDRTKMIDIVRYSLPMGFLGRIVHAVKVRRDVQGIFEYRRKVIEERFG